MAHLLKRTAYKVRSSGGRPRCTGIVENCYGPSRKWTARDRELGEGSAARNLDQSKKAPDDVGADEGPDGGCDERTVLTFHEVGENAADENEKERNGGKKKCCARNARMSDAQTQEEQSD